MRNHKRFDMKTGTKQLDFDLIRQFSNSLKDLKKGKFKQLA